MEPAQRAAVVQSVADRKQRELDCLQAVAGPPCSRCRYERRNIEYDARNKSHRVSYCTAPPVQDFKFDPIDRELNVSSPLRATAARAPSGMCGVEAHMFAPKPPVRALIRYLNDSEHGGAVYVTAAAIAFVTLATIFS